MTTSWPSIWSTSWRVGMRGTIRYAPECPPSAVGADIRAGIRVAWVADEAIEPPIRHASISREHRSDPDDHRRSPTTPRTFTRPAIGGVQGREVARAGGPG